jgi:hypothetical protein
MEMLSEKTNQWRCVVLVKPNILKTISDSFSWNKNKMCDLNFNKEEREAKILTEG